MNSPAAGKVQKSIAEQKGYKSRTKKRKIHRRKIMKENTECKTVCVVEGIGVVIEKTPKFFQKESHASYSEA